MIASRRYLALDLRPGELRAVALRGRKGHPVLDGARVMALPQGLFVASLREPNIRDQARLITAIGEVLHPLAGSEERLAIALPETAGRLLLAEAENPFGSRAEGEQILKWQLKAQLPADPTETRLDFQVLGRREDGRVRLIVAAIANRVLDQYEEIVTAAGYHPEQIGFHSLFLHNFYRNRIERPEECILVSVESGFLSFEYSQGQIPVYYRFRETGDDPTAIFQEITRALVGTQEEFPGLRRAEILLQCDRTDPTPLIDTLRAAFQREIMLLDPHLGRMAATPADLPEWRLRGLATAVGAAEQLM